jgi:hypothetical protein
MEINIKTAYELGQEVNENDLTGVVVRIEVVVYSEDRQDVVYILDNGGKIIIHWKKP